MSVWKSNFFLQTGLPESLPKPPERPVAADEDFAVEHGLAPTRRVGQRGKDKHGRKKRAPSLFNFFQCMRSLESREADGNVIVRPEELRVEYHALSKQTTSPTAGRRKTTSSCAKPATRRTCAT